jgi:hypothetical protein
MPRSDGKTALAPIVKKCEDAQQAGRFAALMSTDWDLAVA